MQNDEMSRWLGMVLLTGVFAGVLVLSGQSKKIRAQSLVDEIEQRTPEIAELELSATRAGERTAARSPQQNRTKWARNATRMKPRN